MLSGKTYILQFEVEIKVTGLFLLLEYMLQISRALMKQFNEIFLISLLSIFRLLFQFVPSVICSMVISLPHISAPHLFINNLIKLKNVFPVWVAFLYIYMKFMYIHIHNYRSVGVYSFIYNKIYTLYSYKSKQVIDEIRFQLKVFH